MRRSGAGEHRWAEVSLSEVNADDRFRRGFGRSDIAIMPVKADIKWRWRCGEGVRLQNYHLGSLALNSLTSFKTSNASLSPFEKIPSLSRVD